MEFENSRIEQARAENELLLEDLGSAKKKKRADKRRRRKYKFSDKRHSRRGIAAVILAGIALVFVVTAVALSASREGQGGVEVGILPFAALLLTTAGMILCLTTFHRSDLIFTWSWAGLISSLVIWLMLAFVLVIGL